MSAIIDKINSLKKLMEEKTTTIAQLDECKVEIANLEKDYDKAQEAYKDMIKEKITSNDVFKYVTSSQRMKQMDYVFVTFKDREFLYQNYHKLQSHKEGFNSKSMSISEAMDPDQINWENIRPGNFKWQKKGITIMIYLI